MPSRHHSPTGEPKHKPGPTSNTEAPTYIGAALSAPVHDAEVEVGHLALSVVTLPVARQREILEHPVKGRETVVEVAIAKGNMRG